MYVRRHIECVLCAFSFGHIYKIIIEKAHASFEFTSCLIVFVRTEVTINTYFRVSYIQRNYFQCDK